MFVRDRLIVSSSSVLILIRSIFSMRISKLNRLLLNSQEIIMKADRCLCISFRPRFLFFRATILVEISKAFSPRSKILLRGKLNLKLKNLFKPILKSLAQPSIWGCLEKAVSQRLNQVSILKYKDSACIVFFSIFPVVSTTLPIKEIGVCCILYIPFLIGVATSFFIKKTLTKENDLYILNIY